MALRAPWVPDGSLDTTGPLGPTFHLPPVRYARRPSRPPDASASSRPLSYSEWESNPVSGRLNLDHSSRNPDGPGAGRALT